MRGLLENIIASENSDVPRFIEFYETQIKDKKLESTKKFKETKDKMRLLPDEKVEAKAEKNKIKQAKANKAAAQGGSMADLQNMILAKRENAFGGFMNYMTEKYGKDDEESPAKKRKLSAHKGENKK